MAPRAYWKGYLRLSLVQSPVALFPAATETEKIRFHQLNRRTGHRIRNVKVDVETGEEVGSKDVIMGYEVSKGRYIQITEAELEAIALDSKHTIDIDEFVPKKEIDERYYLRPYYVAPDGDIGLDAFAVIRDVLAKMDRVALGRVILTNREHVIALERRGKGLVGMLLRYSYEIRNEHEYFDGIPDVKLPKDMLDLAEHIVKARSSHFAPDKLANRYENALRELIRRKQNGETIEPKRSIQAANVVNLVEALRRSVEAESGRARTRHHGRAPQRQPPRRLGARARTRATTTA
jgi:DNA end-binding protein Ku